MAQVWLIVEPEQAGLPSAQITSGVDALKEAIARYPTPSAPDTVELLSLADLSPALIAQVPAEAIVCPLTTALPESSHFSGAAIFRACHAVEALRESAARELGATVGEGNLWLPVAVTARGPLYGEAIAPSPSAPGEYQQPHHLSDRQRQPLYALAFRLLNWLNAPPSVYLLQFGLSGDRVIFDRLFPYPAPAAIASLNVQTPDLFTAHWLCLSSQPLLDLTIANH